jgi:hypothetical protein
VVVVVVGPIIVLLGGKVRSETPARHASATVMMIATFVVLAMPTRLELSFKRRQVGIPSI